MEGFGNIKRWLALKNLRITSWEIALLYRVLKITRVLFGYAVNGYVKRVKVCKPPIFIVGCEHSGTSLLLAILGAHSRIYAIPYESKLAYRLKPKTYLKRFDMLAISAGKPRWVEKTPRHIHCIDKLLELCSDAKILLIIRDGRDVACSIQDRYGCIELGIKRWVEHNRAGETFWNHPHVYVLRYEQLIENFELVVTDILNFLGEHYEPGMHEYHHQPKYYYANNIQKPPNAFRENHRPYRNWQINQPLFDGRGKWKRMTEQEKLVIKEYANEMLVEYGYVNNVDW